MTNKHILLLLLLAQTYIVLGQNTEHQNHKDSIPFVLTAHNNITIKAQLNDQDSVVLMLHTAANDLSLIEASTDSLKTLKWSEEEEVQSWGGTSSSRFSAVNTLSINQLSWDSISIWESQRSGPETDGKFGLNLFSDQYVEINFESSFVVLHHSKPHNLASYEKLPLIYEDGLMFVEGICHIGEEAISNRYLIHSGYAGSVLLDDQFVADHQIAEQIEITSEQELKDSYGNIIKTKKGKLAGFQIGQQLYQEIAVGFFEGALGRQKISVIGGDILKRFNLIIDPERTYIYIKANELKDLVTVE